MLTRHDKFPGPDCKILFDCDFLLSFPLVGWPSPAQEWVARERMGRVSYSLEVSPLVLANLIHAQVTPNLAYRRALQGVQANLQEGEVEKVQEKEGRKPSLSPEELVARRHIFTNALTQLVSAWIGSPTLSLGLPPTPL